MDNPRKLKNRIVLLVSFIVVTLVLLTIVIGIGRGAFTGFFSLNENQEAKNETSFITGNAISSPEDINEELSNVKNTGDKIIHAPNVVIPNKANASSNTTNFTKTTTRNSRRGGGGNNLPIINQNLTNSKKRLSKIPTSMDLKYNGIKLNEGDEFEGPIRLKLERFNHTISAFNVTFINDVDVSDIVGDSDFVSGKSFMHSPSGLLEDVDLYIPVKSDDEALIICSNASSYDEVYYGCSELPQITNEEIIYLSDPRVKLSEDKLYYIVRVTGTGAMGVNITELNSTTANATSPGNITAFAGNITEIIMPDNSGVTQSWQGYFGNVTGTIMLADNNDNVMYNWSVASPEGVILASVNNSIIWDNIQCFNFTATGNYTSESGRGETNLFGTNLTQLELSYGLDTNDLDGVDETFTLIGLGTHNLFYINNNEFSEGECYNTRIFDSSGGGVDNHFEEVLLYEPTTSSVVFASILNEDVSGFDKNPHDFEMLVLEDGHGTDLDTTTYYFWAEMY